MGANLLHVLISTTATSSAAILFVGLLRKPLRMAVGARAAYWLWLLVPASAFGALLPVPSQALRLVSTSLPSGVSAALSSVSKIATSSQSGAYVVGAILIWATGAVVMFTLLLRRQRRFVRLLGQMTSDVDGLRRSAAIVAPMLVGAWRSQVVVPIDFEIRYGEEERQLVLAHERAHLGRRDILVNTIAALWLCLSWFNPLMYWAMGRLRLDQELACDALVLARSKTAPRRYADALLNTQLATESAWRMPIGCHWQSSHPLKERVAMLKRPLPGLSRRITGIALALAVTISGGYTAWAAQQVTSTQILVDLKLTVTGVAADIFSASTEYLVNPGEAPTYPSRRPFDARCTAFLPNEGRQSSAWNDQKARGVPITGQIYLECRIGQDGRLVATPAAITQDGESATIETDNPGDVHHYKLEINASTSTEKIEAAKLAAASRRSS
jgi:bla regulator protein blaR1